MLAKYYIMACISTDIPGYVTGILHFAGYFDLSGHTELVWSECV